MRAAAYFSIPLKAPHFKATWLISSGFFFALQYCLASADSARQYAQLGRLVHRLTFAVHRKFGIQVFDVGLHRVHADMAQLGYLVVRKTSGNQL
jgi:hypothetical protein